MDDSREFDPRPGRVDHLEPGLRRILAPNPSPMTFRGTNTYLVGEGEVAVIDPGPDDDLHLAAILSALSPGERITEILVTHAHRDHSPLARPLSRATGAPVLAFGDHLAGRSAVMAELVAGGLTGGGEGVDADFAPDIRLSDGQRAKAGDRTLTALWTPGHFGNHLCFALGDALFTGDHVMGWATSLVSPPDGDLTAFMASTRRLARRRDRIHYPGHGAPIRDPDARLRRLIEHRQMRESQILAALDQGAQTVDALTRTIYHDLSVPLRPMARRNVFAHLVDLSCKNRIHADPTLSDNAIFHRR